MNRQPNILQLLWGVALAAAGIGVFLVLPRRMAQIAEVRQVDSTSFEMLFLWFCFGLLGVLLVGGGLRKVMRCLKTRPDDENE